MLPCHCTARCGAALPSNGYRSCYNPVSAPVPVDTPMNNNIYILVIMSFVLIS